MSQESKTSNSNPTRRAFKQSEVEYAWNKADPIPGMNPDLYRQDKVGNVVYKPSRGTQGSMAYDIDHSRPLNQGGTYHPNNLQVLQSNQNRSKGDTVGYDYNSEPRGVRPEPIPVKANSKAVRSGELNFKPDGSVDRRSSAVYTGAVLLTQNGDIDKRSSAVRQGAVRHRKGTE